MTFIGFLSPTTRALTLAEFVPHVADANTVLIPAR